MNKSRSSFGRHSSQAKFCLDTDTPCCAKPIHDTRVSKSLLSSICQRTRCLSLWLKSTRLLRTFSSSTARPRTRGRTSMLTVVCFYGYASIQFILFNAYIQISILIYTFSRSFFSITEWRKWTITLCCSACRERWEFCRRSSGTECWVCHWNVQNPCRPTDSWSLSSNRKSPLLRFSDFFLHLRN